MQAVQPRPFGLRQVPPSILPPEPENPALEWAKSQVSAQQERLQTVAQSARPMANAFSTWLYTLACAGVPVSGMAFAGLVAVSKSAGQSILRRLKSIEFRRERQIVQPNPLLDSIAQSWRGVFVRTLSYVCGIGMLSIFAAEVFQSAPVVAAVEPVSRPEWVSVAKPYPAFHLSMSDVSEDQRYSILRHGEGGGRRDILTWGEPGHSARYATIEIYRPGNEIENFSVPIIEFENRAAELNSATNVRESWPIDTKFGPVSTADFSIGETGSGHCIAFIRTFNEPRVQISGVSCNANALVDRASLGCALDKLTLMSAGSAPDIAKLFAQAELKRNFCGHRDPILYATPRRSIDANAQAAPALRGRFVR